MHVEISQMGRLYRSLGSDQRAVEAYAVKFINTEKKISFPVRRSADELFERNLIQKKNKITEYNYNKNYRYQAQSANPLKGAKNEYSRR